MIQSKYYVRLMEICYREKAIKSIEQLEERFNDIKSLIKDYALAIWDISIPMDFSEKEPAQFINNQDELEHIYSYSCSIDPILYEETKNQEELYRIYYSIKTACTPFTPYIETKVIKNRLNNTSGDNQPKYTNHSLLKYLADLEEQGLLIKKEHMGFFNNVYYIWSLT